jgi:hypothetical protein
MPLALLWQAPLGMCLMNAGQNRYNLRQHLPVEVAPGVLLQPERMGLVARHVNQVTQVILRAAMTDLYTAGRGALRRGLGLPPRAGPGLFSVPAGVARVVNVISCLRELVRAGRGGGPCLVKWADRPRDASPTLSLAQCTQPNRPFGRPALPPRLQEAPGRPVPPEWHLVAPQGVPLPPGGALPEVADAPMRAFLDRAAGERGRGTEPAAADHCGRAAARPLAHHCRAR